MKKYKGFNVIGIVTKFIYRFKNLSFVKHILLFYLIITFSGAGLLMAPFAQRTGVYVDFQDALFTSASAFSDTGLTSLVTAETWSIGGQAIIALLIFVGGLGWFALKVYLFNIILGRPISFAERDALAAERGSDKVGFSKNIIKISVTILLIIVVVASIVLSVFFFYSTPDGNPYEVNSPLMNNFNNENDKRMIFENPHDNYLNSLRFGVFHAVSALNNAGFDIIGSNSIAPYYHTYSIQFIFVILFVLGGIGYPVIYDAWNWINAKIRREKYYWSLFSKLSVSVYLLVSIIGVSSTFAIETTAKDYMVDGANKVYTFWNNPMYGSTSDKSIALFFNSMSTRNAGFSTIRLGDLSPTTISLFSVLMFIGSAPSSTAGGIRTTTLGVIVVGLWSRIRGRDEVRIFNRRVPNRTIIRSYIVLAVSIMVVIIVSLIAFSSFAHAGGQVNKDGDSMFLMRTVGSGEHYVPTQYTFNELVFEVSSAFGTTGLTAGITSNLSLAAKLALILSMFIGQLGVSSSILIWSARKGKTRNYKFVKEDVTIG